ATTARRPAFSGLGCRSTALVLFDKAGDEPGERVRLFHVDAMARTGDGLEPRVGQRFGVNLAGALRHDLIVIAPDDERRGLYPTQQMRQRRVVHVWLPGDAEAHLAAKIPVD